MASDPTPMESWTLDQFAALRRSVGPERQSLIDEVVRLRVERDEDIDRYDREFQECWKILCKIRCAYYGDPKASDGACPQGMSEMLGAVLGWMQELRGKDADDGE